MDPIFQATQDYACNEKAIASAEKTVKACEEELKALRDIAAMDTRPWWYFGLGRPSAVSIRSRYLADKMLAATRKVDTLDMKNKELKKDRTLTVRLVREKVELTYALEPGTLEAKEYKRALKQVIMDATAEAKSKFSDENQGKTDTGDEVAGTHSKKSSKATKKPQKRRGEAGKVYKSAETIECSDMEDFTPETETNHEKDLVDKNPQKRKVSKPKSPAKKRRKIVPSDDESGNELKSPSKLKEQDVENSGDEFSSLFGGSPGAGKKPSTSKDKVHKEKLTQQKAKSKEDTTGKSNMKSTSESKDEVTIKRLKSFVNACGVRKPWTKIFQDSPKPSQKIKKLKEILAELGMTGRMSMEQAKKIRRKRELAQELEDVQSFEQSALVRGSRSQTASTSRHTKTVQSDDDESEAPTWRKAKALQSINAFLEDQSDDD
ncbi:hypothetical protein H0H81_008334 [Sphagnurus paluster]|uniref:Uncharacterized protein n=1 Tax=Sphagnurus paluster TaxID=117069 RepID=A0A9P7GR62_9AGAR|nr:hypothetical protein H0H81_008334 [Sphagnurus paluster]